MGLLGIIGCDYAAKSRLYQELAVMVRAGVSIHKAMETVAQHDWRELLADTKIAQAESRPVSWVMKRHPGSFSEFEVSVVRTGEDSGALDGQLSCLEQDFDRRDRIRKKMVSAFTYPAFVILFALCLPGIISFFSCPGGACMGRLLLPLMFIFGGLALLAILLTLGANIPSVKAGMDRLLWYTPGVAKVVRLFCISRFCSTFGGLQSAGLLTDQALESAAASCGSAYAAEKLKATAPAILAGKRASVALAATGLLPAMALTMLASGEEAGEPDKMLVSVASYLEDEGMHAAERLSKVVVVLAMVLAGGYVALQAVQIMSGVVDSYGIPH